MLFMWKHYKFSYQIFGFCCYLALECFYSAKKSNLHSISSKPSFYGESPIFVEKLSILDKQRPIFVLEFPFFPKKTLFFKEIWISQGKSKFFVWKSQNLDKRKFIKNTFFVKKKKNLQFSHKKNFHEKSTFFKWKPIVWRKDPRYSTKRARFCLKITNFS